MSCGQNKTRTTNKENENLIETNSSWPCIDSIMQARYGTQKRICFLSDIKKHKKIIKENPNIMVWLDEMQEEFLSAYTIENSENRYLILTSVPWGVTGTTTNFLFYLIIDCNKATIIEDEILSLSNGTNGTINWFVKNDKIHFIAFEFGDEFYTTDCDWHNLPLKATEYVILGNHLYKDTSFEFRCIK
jgi:hypothetical protein